MTTSLEILEKSFRPIEIPECVPLGRKLGCGVYLLISYVGEILYVGASSQIEMRLYAHGRGTSDIACKEFDRVMWLQLPEAVLSHYEGALARALRPRFCRKFPRSRGYDAEILFGLGLRDVLSEDDVAWEEAA